MKALIPVLLLLVMMGCSMEDKPKEKPNFLFIMVDDLVPVLGSYGNKEVKSPNIDQLSSQSIQFNRAFCNVPVCGASRASMLTGIRPHFPERFIIHFTRADEDYPKAVTLPELLKMNGYYTISNGKIFHNPEDSEDSWSEKPWRSEEGSNYNNPSSRDKINQKTKRGPFFEMAEVEDTAYADGRIAERTIHDLQRLSKMGQPFFLAAGFRKPHLPFNAPKKYFDLYDSVSLADNRFPIENLPKASNSSKEIVTYGYTDHYNTEEFHQEARLAYYACVSYVDTQIGKIFEELKNLGLEENTVVVLIGDHGFHLGDHNLWGKHNTLYNALHAPLIIKVPGNKPLRVDKIVEFVDLYPTICELAELPVSAELQGTSMLPLINGQKTDWKNTAFSEWQGARSLLSDGFSYSYWPEDKYEGAEMLFDHNKDPEENKNVAGLPAYIPIVKNQKQTILNLYKKIEKQKDQ